MMAPLFRIDIVRMRIGAHVSAAGGLHHAPENAAELGLQCFQFFSRPPQGGRVAAITPAAADLFRSACARYGFSQCYIHAPYVINLASAEKRIRENTIDILRGELDRGSALGATAMMFHPGSASGVGPEKAMAYVIEGMKRVLDGYDGATRPLIEISAGAGEVIADTFEEIRSILDGTGDERLGVCFDTAHAFASGYDLRDKETVAATMGKFDAIIGLDRLLISHCNDSKVGLGEKRDRHEHLGEGHIGSEGFRAVIASPAFANIDLILETPVDQVEKDIAFLKAARGRSDL